MKLPIKAPGHDVQLPIIDRTHQQVASAAQPVTSIFRVLFRLLQLASRRRHLAEFAPQVQVLESCNTENFQGAPREEALWGETVFGAAADLLADLLVSGSRLKPSARSASFSACPAYRAKSDFLSGSSQFKPAPNSGPEDEYLGSWLNFRGLWNILLLPNILSLLCWQSVGEALSAGSRRRGMTSRSASGRVWPAVRLLHERRSAPVPDAPHGGGEVAFFSRATPTLLPALPSPARSSTALAIARCCVWCSSAREKSPSDLYAFPRFPYALPSCVWFSIAREKSPSDSCAHPRL